MLVGTGDIKNLETKKILFLGLGGFGPSALDMLHQLMCFADCVSGRVKMISSKRDVSADKH